MNIQSNNKETVFYIKALEPLYRETSISNVDLDEIDMDKLLHLATVDNALDYISRYLIDNHRIPLPERSRLESIVSEGEKEFRQASHTIQDMRRHIRTDHIVFKTFKGSAFQRIGNDIDVLVKHQELDSLQEVLISRGYRDVVRFPKHERCIMVKKPGQINLHIQSRIHWCGKEYLDEALIWDSPKEVKYMGHSIRINNANADFLLHLAHINFEHPFFRLSELLYLFTLAAEVDLNMVLEQAQKYKWKRTLLRNLYLMNHIHRMLYDAPMANDFPFKQLNIRKVSFPFMFTRRHMLLSVLEKRITYYLLGRMFKLCRVLITGETCSYTQPPERGKLTKDGKQVIKESIFRGAINSARHRLLRTLDGFQEDA